MNTQYWENKFNRWALGPSQTEQDKANRAERMVRDAITSYAPLNTREIRVFSQGSYRNRTNVRADSDVDICVLSKAGFYGDYSLVPGVGNQSLGYTDASYTLHNLKADVEAALKAHFGAPAITRGDKAFDVRENTSRIAADVVPAFEGRLFFRNGLGLQYHSGAVLQCASNSQLIYNWPEQHYANGVSRHESTGQQFKKKARCLKNLRYEMADGGSASAKAMSSFLLESLVYNCPDATFQHPSHLEDMKAVIIHLWDATKEEACEKTMVEVNGIKYLFHSTQGWNRAATRTFLQDAWNHVGFGT
jgi:hypothetical protein